MVPALQPFAQSNLLLKKTGVRKTPVILPVAPKGPASGIGKKIGYGLKQLVAGKAFRLFGLHNMPIYNIDGSFMQPIAGMIDIGEETCKLASLKRVHAVLREGFIYQNSVADYVSDLPYAHEDADVLAYSKIMRGLEAVIIYNTSAADAKEKFITVNQANNGIKQLNSLYGFDTAAQFPVYHAHLGPITLSYIKIYLRPLQLVILANY